MLKELKFVMGAVAKKDLVASMTHFCIENGTVRSYNGRLALSSPINFNIDCKPKASTLVKAIAQCEDTISLSFTKAGRLHVKSGAFSALVDCISEETPHVEPDGEPFNIDGEVLLDCFKKIEPFIGDDASRPWTNGILLRGQSAFATNNAMIVEFWHGVETPVSVNIPRDAIREILRINEPPTHAQLTKNSITFHFEDTRWIRSDLLATEWPDISRILDITSNPVPVDPALFAAVESLKGFTGPMSELYLFPGYITTHRDEGEGAEYKIEGFQGKGCYRHEMLTRLKGVAETVDFQRYPQPCTFFGSRLRGVFIGMSM